MTSLLGCGALHLYGTHLAEIRSIAVWPRCKGTGAGRVLMDALLEEAEQHHVHCVCLFTRIPKFFAHMGFTEAKREELPDKIYKDCANCPKLHACDEVAMYRGELPQLCDSSSSRKAAIAPGTSAGETREMNLHGPDEPVFLPQGFLWSATKAGIKASGRSDVALAEAPLGASAAAMFTRNRVAAAPVEVGRAHLRKSKGRVRAVLVNAGNANCATGAQGLVVAEQSCAALGTALEAAPQFIIPSSTGIIGVPLPVRETGRRRPCRGRRTREGDEDALKAFATAIMTTDTRMKLASAEFDAGKKKVHIAGVCKGAGMIHPNMATMLVYLFTDLDAEPKELRCALKAAVDTTFHAISVDGDTSTNDTVLLLASAASKVKLVRQWRGQKVCRSPARRLRLPGRTDRTRRRRRKASGPAPNYRRKIRGRGANHRSLDC